MTQQEVTNEMVRDLRERIKALEKKVESHAAALLLFGQAGEDLEERVCALERKADTGLVVPIGVQPS